MWLHHQSDTGKRPLLITPSCSKYHQRWPLSASQIHNFIVKGTVLTTLPIFLWWGRGQRGWFGPVIPQFVYKKHCQVWIISLILRKPLDFFFFEDLIIECALSYPKPATFTNTSHVGRNKCNKYKSNQTVLNHMINYQWSYTRCGPCFFLWEEYTKFLTLFFTKKIAFIWTTVFFDSESFVVGPGPIELECSNDLSLCKKWKSNDARCTSWDLKWSKCNFFWGKK